MRLQLLFVTLVASLLGVTLSIRVLAPRNETVDGDENLLEHIHSVLSYYNLHPDGVSRNFRMAVMLSGEQLRASKSVDVAIENDVDKLLALCEAILKNTSLSEPVIYDETVTMIGESLPLLRSPKGELNRTGFPPYELETNLNYGSPAPLIGSFCLLGALMDKTIPDNCLDQMSDPEARGYFLSNQAFFFTLTASVLPTPFVLKSIREKCEKMFSEVLYAWMNQKPEILRPLIVEDAAVCGISRYEEFLEKQYLDYILSLQREEGCFAIAKEGPQSNCDDHLSSVSLIALTNFLYEKSAISKSS